jgi:hypothetical protein
MVHAAATLPEVSRHALSSSYADAFTSLLHVLIVITLLAALATFAFLSRTPPQDDEPGSMPDESQHEKEVADEAVSA